MLRDGEADVLAVWKFDRWSRQGLSAVADLIDTLDVRADALFVALSDGLRSNRPAWRIIASVLAEVARMEAENMSLRVRSSVRKLKTTGRFSGGTVPFGYRSAPASDGPGRVLEVDPIESAIVRELAERVLAGELISHIVANLNDRAIPTAGSEARRAAHAGGDPKGLPVGRWHLSTLKTLLTAEMLLGRVLLHGRPVLDDAGLPLQVWPPILDLATMVSLRARLGQPRQRSNKPQAHRRASRLLSGVIFCAHCGQKCYIRSQRGYFVYGCPGQQLGGDACPTPRISAPAVESYITETFLALVGDLPELRYIEIAGDPGAETELEEIEAAIAEVAAAFADDNADPTALLSRMATLKDRRTSLRALPKEIQVVEERTGRSIREAWQAEEDENLAEKRRILTAYLDHATLASTRKRGGTFNPERVSLMWRS